MKIPSKTNTQLKAVMNKSKQMMVKKVTMTMGQLTMPETKIVQRIVEKQMRVAIARSMTEVQTVRMDQTVRAKVQMMSTQ